MWEVRILTLFPEIYPGMLSYSVTGRALMEGKWEISAKNIRDFAVDKYQTVDDAPYGGGKGMVMRADVIGRAIEEFFLVNNNPIIYLTPRGKLFKQPIANEFSNKKGINILCGRFEGIDERILLYYDVCEISLGDYVLSSGDTAAFPFLDACVRLLPGVLGRDSVLMEESFGLSERYRDMLEYPHYTKPRLWNDLSVPEVLLSGNHRQIDDWRFQKAKEKTNVVRPDLLCKK